MSLVDAAVQFVLREDQAPSFRLWNWIAEFSCRPYPKTHGIASIPQRFGLRLAVGHTAGKFRHFCDKSLIIVAPVDDDFVLVHIHSPSARSIPVQVLCRIRPSFPHWHSGTDATCQEPCPSKGLSPSLVPVDHRRRRAIDARPRNGHPKPLTMPCHHGQGRLFA